MRKWKSWAMKVRWKCGLKKMKTEWEIEVVGELEPVTFKRPCTSGKRRYEPEDYKRFKEELGYVARRVMGEREPLSEPLRAQIEIYRRVKISSLNYGDLDNHIKACLDALNGICYKDDRQIVEIHAKKLKGAPKVIIRIGRAE